MAIYSRTVNLSGVGLAEVREAIGSGAVRELLGPLEGDLLESARRALHAPVGAGGWIEDAGVKSVTYSQAIDRVSHRIEAREDGAGVAVTYSVGWTPRSMALVPVAYVLGVLACVVGVIVPIVVVGKIKIESRIAADGFIDAVKKWAGPRAATDEQELVVD